MTPEEFAARGAAAQEAIDAFCNRWRFHADMQPRDDELLQFALYRHPVGAPDMFVVRAWFVGKDGLRLGRGFAFGGEDGEARALGWISQEFPDLVRLERDPNDEPHIVAVWT